MNEKKILIASKNPDKTKEISLIFNEVLLSLNDLETVKEIEETGDTFAENSKIKAEYYYNCFKIPVIADDSGLVVPALNGKPGVYSARYAGENADYRENNSKLLNEMKNLKGDERSAFFICHAVFFNGIEFIEAEGKVNGYIIEELKGNFGFGYDPLFFIRQLGKTFAEISLSEKNKISHRFIAFSKLKQKMKNYLQ